MLSAFLISRQKLSYFSNSARMMLHPAAGLFSPGAARGIQNGVPSRPFAQAAGLSAPHLSSSDILSRGQSTQARARPANKSDLLALKGVGPVNAGLLLAQQITSVETLQEIYCNELKRDKQELLRFLSEVVGFRNPAHCRSVADHLEDLPYQPSPLPIKLAVEGNIGAGKSTFLDILQDRNLELQDMIEVVPEPVEEWQRVQNGESEPINLLDRFYKDPMKYAYTFQHYVLLTRMEKDRKARASTKPLRVLERSIFSDRLVFVRAMHEAGYIGDLELRLYDSWFSMQIAQDTQLTPNGFIYLKARPETCIKRLRMRNRSEEGGVDRAYLENLHDKHESWLHFGARNAIGEPQGSGMLETISQLQRGGERGSDGRSLRFDQPHLDLLKSAPAIIRDNIVFLGPDSTRSGGTDSGEDKVLQVLSGVPTLVLDHEQEDIMHDLDARKDYAQKVKAFSEYVGTLRSSRPKLDLMPGASNTTGSLLVHPGSTLSSPDGVNLTQDQVDSLRHVFDDYRRLVQAQKNYTKKAEQQLLMVEGQLGWLGPGGMPGGASRGRLQTA